MTSEIFISVDVETAGPHPGGHLLTVHRRLSGVQPRAHVLRRTEARERQRRARRAGGVSPVDGELAQRGVPPAKAMARFERWLGEEVPRATSSPCSWPSTPCSTGCS